MASIADYSIYRTTIDQVMQGSERLPSLPALTMEIRNASADENITIPRLSRLIARDPSLVVMIMRYTSSPVYRAQEPAKSLEDAIRLLGIPCVDNLVMLHSIRSLFIIQNPKLKTLFNAAWKRQTIKAAMSLYLAKKLGINPPDEALIASLLSEVGTLAILSALTSVEQTPDQATYLELCRQYSKSLGTIILKKWSFDEHYIDVIRHCGEWQGSQQTTAADADLSISDVINLSLYHGVALVKKQHSLPPLNELQVFQKLPAPFNQLDERGLLQMVTHHLDDIAHTARTLH